MAFNPYTGGLGTPPFLPIPIMVPVLAPATGPIPYGLPAPNEFPPIVTQPDTGQPLPSSDTVPPAQTPYEPGPFCFGLDTALCSSFDTIKVGPRLAQVEIPVREICKTLTNVVCGLFVAFILVVVLGIALQGLLQ